AELSFLDTYAQTQEAFGTVLVSLGFSPLPDDYNSKSVSELSRILSEANTRWFSGELELAEIHYPDIDEQLVSEPSADEVRSELPDLVGLVSSDTILAEAVPVDALRRLVELWLDSWVEQNLEAHFALYDPGYYPASYPSIESWRQNISAKIIGPIL